MIVAIAQINPIIADVDGNRAKIIGSIDEARKLDADLIVFPKMATIGYPPMDLLENRKLIADNLLSIEKIAAHCQDIAAIIGYVDHVSENGLEIFNSAAFIAEGKIVSSHHAYNLPSYDVFDEPRFFTPATSLKTVKLKGTNIGITIGGDIWDDQPEEYFYIPKRRIPIDPVATLVNKGIDILVNLSAEPYCKGGNTVKWRMMSSIAKKNSVPLLYVNQVGGNDSLIFDGGSFLLNKRGEFISMAKSFEEDLLLVNTDSPETPITPCENTLEDIRRALVLGIRDYLNKCGFTDAVIGLSGGIDSALTAALAVEALGPEHVLGITMPSLYSSPGSVDDSIDLARSLGIRIHTIPISGLFDDFKKTLADIFEGQPEDVTEENIQARIRGTLLMSISNKFGNILLTTGNKSEIATGYCTLYGDMAGGLAVLSDLPKTLVYSLSKHINREKEIIPVATIEKVPSAELRYNQKDQDSLPPYDLLDGILECYLEKRMSAEEIIQLGFASDVVEDILHKVNISEFKRIQAAPGLKITSKAFGTGRRIPIVKKYRP